MTDEPHQPEDETLPLLQVSEEERAAARKALDELWERRKPLIWPEGQSAMGFQMEWERRVGRVKD